MFVFSIFRCIGLPKHVILKQQEPQDNSEEVEYKEYKDESHRDKVCSPSSVSIVERQFSTIQSVNTTSWERQFAWSYSFYNIQTYTMNQWKENKISSVRCKPDNSQKP